MDFAVPADYREKIKKFKKRDKYLDLARYLENNNNTTTMEYESNGDTNCGWCYLKNCPRIGKVTGRLRNKRTSRDHRNYSIINIDQNPEKIPRDLRRFAVNQTSVRNHQLRLR